MRSIVLLFAYSLCLAMPLLHRQEFASEPDCSDCRAYDGSAAIMACGCGEGCNDPNHHHHRPPHDPSTCWICKSFEFNRPLLIQSATALDAIGLVQRCVFEPTLSCPAAPLTGDAIRGPPGPSIII